MSVTRYWVAIGIALSTLHCTVPKEPLNIAGNGWLGYQPLYIANELISCEQCIDVNAKGDTLHRITMLPSTTMVLRLFANDELDVVMLTLDEALLFQSQTHEDICVASVLSYSNGADAAFSREQALTPPIRIGYEASALGAYMLRRMMESLKWQANDIVLKEVTPKQHASAIANNDVDVVITFEPYATQLRDTGAKQIFDSRSIPGEIVDLVVVKKATWQKHNEHIKWVFGDYWRHGLALIEQQDPAAIALLQSFSELQLNQLTNALKGLLFLGPDASEVFLNNDFAKVVASMNRYLLENSQIEHEGHLPVCWQGD